MIWWNDKNISKQTEFESKNALCNFRLLNIQTLSPSLHLVDFSSAFLFKNTIIMICSGILCLMLYFLAEYWYVSRWSLSDWNILQNQVLNAMSMQERHVQWTRKWQIFNPVIGQLLSILIFHWVFLAFCSCSRRDNPRERQTLFFFFRLCERNCRNFCSP